MDFSMDTGASTLSKMNRLDLEQLTGKAFSSSAYRCIDDEWQVAGKFCRAVYLGNGHWDVWLCNTADLDAGLSQRKIRSIAAGIAENGPVAGGFRELTGEGVYQRMLTAHLLQNAPLLGIKRRRSVNPERIQRVLEISRRHAV